MTPEGKVKQSLRKYLDSKGCWYYLPVSNGMGAHGIPDVIGCHNGRLFAIEVKAPGRRNETNRGASGLQAIQMAKIEKAGGFAMMFDGENDDWLKLMEWIG